MCFLIILKRQLRPSCSAHLYISDDTLILNNILLSAPQFCRRNLSDPGGALTSFLKSIWVSGDFLHRCEVSHYRFVSDVLIVAISFDKCAFNANQNGDSKRRDVLHVLGCGVTVLQSLAALCG